LGKSPTMGVGSKLRGKRFSQRGGELEREKKESKVDRRFQQTLGY